MVAKLIAAGASPEVAAEVVAEAFEAGVRVNSTGIPRNSADEVAEKRRAYDRDRKRNSAGIPPESTGNAEITLSKSNLREEKREASEVEFRGNWRPPEPEWNDAVAKLGLQAAESELVKFRERTGSILRILPDWRVWVQRAVDYQAKTKPPPALPTMQSATFDWDAVVKMWHRTGHWSSQAGPDPESPACRCPREILEKHALLAMKAAE